MKTWAQVHVEEPPALVDPLVPEVETPPTQSELEKRFEEAERMGEVGRLLGSSPTQQMAQMVVEAGPSMSGGEEPARRKVQPIVGGNAAWKEFLKAGKGKKPPKVLTGDCSSM